MAGLFGGAAKGSAAYNPSGANWNDRLLVLGSLLSDLNSGQGPDAVFKAQTTIGNRQAAELARQRQQQMAGMIDSTFADDPRARLAAYLNPEKFGEALSSAQQAANVSGGDSRYIPGHGWMTAPKLVGDNGVYGTQTEAGYTQTGARGPSVAETQTAAQNAVQNALNLDKFDFDRWLQRKQLGIAQQNANSGSMTAQTGRLSYEARKAAGGFGTPGVGAVLGGSLPSGWQEVK
jgi:hypothetical protein